MEIIISYAFAHIIEAIILWMSMSQMYEHRYKQWVTGIAIMAGHAVMFVVFLTGNIYFITAINNSMYIVLMALMFNVSKRSAVFWALIYNAMMAISEQLVFFSTEYMLRYVVNGIQEKKSFEAIMTYLLCILFLNVFVFGIFSNVYKNIFDPWLSRRLDVYVNKLIFKKSLEVDLAALKIPNIMKNAAKQWGISGHALKRFFRAYRVSSAFLYRSHRI